MSKPLCKDCVTGFVIPGEPSGTQTKLGNYTTYVATPKEGVSDESKVIVSFSDIFGMQKNNMIVADMLSQHTGYTVYLPDLFNGKPLSLSSLNFPGSTKEAESLTFTNKVTDTFKFLMVFPWFIRNWPSRKDADVLVFLNALRNEKGFKKVGGIGYCYGAKFAVDSNNTGLLDVSVVCHPSQLSVDSFKKVKGPIMFNCAETDDMFNDAMREQVKANLDSDPNAPVHDFKVFENCVHGFCARPDMSDPKVKQGFEEASTRSANWFKSYL